MGKRLWRSVCCYATWEVTRGELVVEDVCERRLSPHFRGGIGLVCMGGVCAGDETMMSSVAEIVGETRVVEW